MRKFKWIAAVLLILLLCGQRSLVESEAQPEIAAEYDTLENQALLAGTAEEGTRIFCSVYTFDDENETTMLYQNYSEVGPSGLYQITIPLPVLGRQYVRVRIGTQESTYAYNRYSNQLAQELQGYYLNVYEVLKGGS